MNVVSLLLAIAVAVGEEPVGADRPPPGASPEPSPEASPEPSPEAPEASGESSEASPGAAPAAPAEGAFAQPADATPDAVQGGAQAEPAPSLERPEPTRKRTPVKLDVSGHAKSFFLLSLPVKLDLGVLPSPTPAVQGVVDGRLNLSLKVGRALRIDAAHAITAFAGQSAGLGGVASTGVGRQAPEAVTLSWSAFDEDGVVDVSGRTDRLLVLVRGPGVDVAVGRMPITFGSGAFFTPMDLINPFTPTTVDSEYKPGVDAIRVDGYVGTSGHLVAVASYQGSWDKDGIAAAAHGQGTIGVTDLAGMYAYVRGDHVVGATVITGVGPVGLHADATVTVPAGGDPVFVRAVVGADGRPTDTTTISGELYVQSLGSADPVEAFGRLDDPRWARGELWLTGIGYYGVGVQQQVVPTLSLGLAVLGSFTEPTALLLPSLGWSIADNADLALGAYIGLGAKPAPTGALPVGDLEAVGAALGVRSEFGTYGSTVFLSLRAWF
jgi:hypothetical protein